MFTNNDLIRHHETLTEELKNNKLGDEKTRDLSLLYIKHLYNRDAQESELNDKKMIEYFSLGWYIHNFLIKNV